MVDAAETPTVQKQQAVPNWAPSEAFRTEIFLVEAAEIGVRLVAIPCELPCKGYP